MFIIDYEFLDFCFAFLKFKCFDLAVLFNLFIYWDSDCIYTF